MSALRTTSVICATLGSLLSSPQSLAAEAPRIVVASDSADTTIIPLLRGELGQLGLEVVEIPAAPTEDIGRELTDAAREYHAVAAFRVRVSSHTVEVWILDRQTGNVSLREVFTQGPASSDEARLVVLQAVELVRWSLKDQPAPAPAGKPMPAKRAVINPSSQAKENRIAFSAAPYALFSPGGGSLGAGAQFDLEFMGSSVGTRLGYSQPLVPASIDADGDSAQLSSRWLSVQMLLGGPRSSRLGSSLGLGAALVITRLHGVAAPPRVAFDDRLFTVAPVADARVGFMVAQSFRFFIGLGALCPLRSDNLVFEGRSVGTYGKLIVTGALGVEANLQ